MAGRRVPLSTLPNGANSPLHGPSATKRGRSAGVLDDPTHDLAPPSKKHTGEDGVTNSQTPRKAYLAAAAAANKRDAAAVERRRRQRDAEAAAAGKQERVEADSQSLEHVRQWQRHYRKAFPEFTFYFENLPREEKSECSRSIRMLGAREVMFFSREVTHVITTRSIPHKSDRTISTDSTAPSVEQSYTQEHADGRTINPSLLEKGQYVGRGASRSKFDFEASLGKRPVPSTSAPPVSNVRKQNVQQADVLQRAQDMGIKIWQVEKLKRVVSTILEGDLQHGHNTRSQATGVMHATKAANQRPLEDLLQDDVNKKTRERDISHCLDDIVQLKGPHIYVYDMNERTKPIMVREYGHVDRREDGDWPQFRPASKFKCPFIEEADPWYGSPEPKPRAKPAERKSKRTTKTEACAEGTLSKAAAEACKPTTERVKGRDALAEVQQGANSRGPRPAQQLPAQPLGFGPFTGVGDKSRFPPPAAGLFIRGEPMASGMQASAMTSAIRSQMVSSTAAAPGAKAGTSREIHGLQRKVLERNSGPLLGGLSACAAPPRPAAAMAAPAAPVVERATARGNPRAAKQRAQEKLGGVGAPNLAQIYEDPDSDEGEECKAAVRVKRAKPAKVPRREPKPGYCENCREKFDDFEEHTQTRKHRKFAMDNENWKELDELLDQLARPGRYDYDH